MSIKSLLIKQRFNCGMDQYKKRSISLKSRCISKSKFCMENKIFYHYYSGIEKDGCNYSLKNLQEGKITFSHVSYFNDPCEIALFPDKEIFITKNSDKRYEYELYFRVFCFSSSFQDPLMWGHYGNAHEGFCIGYDYNDIMNIPEFKNRIAFGAVTYSDEIQKLSDEDIDKGFAIYYKSSAWKNEQEWRASICLTDTDEEHYIISESEFIEAREKWIKKKLFFEKAVDSHLRLLAPATLSIKEAKKRVKRIRAEITNFEIGGYAYSLLKNKKTNEDAYGKFPMRVEGSLKAKVIYVGLRTPDTLRKDLKEYARANEIEIYEMGIEEGKYSFIPKKIIV